MTRVMVWVLAQFLVSLTQAAECPSATVSVAQWRSVIVNLAVKGKYKEAKSMFEACYGKDPNKHPACLADSYDYINHKYYDLSMAANESLAAGQTSIGSVSNMPAEFLLKDASGVVNENRIKFPENIEAVAKANGWPMMTYITRSTGGFDGNSNLTIVAIPGLGPNKSIDAYLQISPNPHENQDWTQSNVDPNLVEISKGDRVLTMITVDKSKNPPEGNSLIMSKMPGQNNVYRWTNFNSAQSCMGCHTNPLRVISPMGDGHTNLTSAGQEKPLNEENKEALSRIKMMMSTSAISWARPTIKVDVPIIKEVTNRDRTDKIEVRETSGKTETIRARVGPELDSQPYGWAPKNSHTRSEEYIKQCAREVPESWNYTEIEGRYRVPYSKPANLESKINAKNIAYQMNCFSCHNNQIRGTLHGDFSHKEMRFKLMIDRKMPPIDTSWETDLTLDERAVLMTCLTKEREDPIVKREWQKSGLWMNQVKCRSESTTTPDSATQTNQ